MEIVFIFFGLWITSMAIMSAIAMLIGLFSPKITERVIGIIALVFIFPLAVISVTFRFIKKHIAIISLIAAIAGILIYYYTI